jgi:hypothetical protein
VTDKEIKRFMRFLKLCESAYELSLWVGGKTAQGEVIDCLLVKDRYTNYKLKVRIKFGEYRDPTLMLKVIELNGRFVTAIRGHADFNHEHSKVVGGKQYHYNQKTFTKYFQRT